MTPAQTGMAVGAVLVIVLATLGFGWFLLIVIAMAIGAGIGRYMEGRLDVSGLIDSVSGKRRSS